MTELMNPIKLIEWLLNFSKGVIDFMGSSITIPGIGNTPIWSLFVGAIAPILLYVLVKRLLL